MLLELRLLESLHRECTGSPLTMTHKGMKMAGLSLSLSCGASAFHGQSASSFIHYCIERFHQIGDMEARDDSTAFLDARAHRLVLGPMSTSHSGRPHHAYVPMWRKGIKWANTSART